MVLQMPKLVKMKFHEQVYEFKKKKEKKIS